MNSSTMMFILHVIFAGIALLNVNAFVIEEPKMPGVLSVPFYRELTPAIVPRRLPGEVLVPVASDHFLCYTATIQLGTPPQQIRVQLDTGSSYLVVQTNVSDFCNAMEIFCTSRGFYSANSSSSYQYIDSSLYIRYLSGEHGKGDYGSDVLSIGDSTVPRFQFGIMYNTTVNMGVFGVAYPSEGTEVSNATSLPGLLVENGYVASRLFSLWINDVHGTSGELLFGAVDTEKYNGNLVTIDMVPFESTRPIEAFSILITDVTVTHSNGSVVETGPRPSHPRFSILDSGTSRTFLPYPIAFSLVRALGGIQVRGEVLIPCDLADTSTTVDFVFQSITIHVPVAQMMELGANYPYCVFSIEMFRSDVVLLGDTALSSMYVVYDMDNYQISLAETVFNANTSNIVPIKAGKNQLASIRGVGSTAISSSTESMLATTGSFSILSVSTNILDKPISAPAVTPTPNLEPETPNTAPKQKRYPNSTSTTTTFVKPELAYSTSTTVIYTTLDDTTTTITLPPTTTPTINNCTPCSFANITSLSSWLLAVSGLVAILVVSY